MEAVKNSKSATFQKLGNEYCKRLLTVYKSIVMKIFILSPNYDTLFSSEFKSQLKKAGTVVVQKEIIPFEKVKGLYEGNEDRILAIDPDFCDWSVPNEAIDKIPNLKAIVLQTTSFSWIDGKHIAELKIPVVNLRGFSSIAVAEWATMIAMNVALKVPVVAQDKWKKDYTNHKGIENRHDSDFSGYKYRQSW